MFAILRRSHLIRQCARTINPFERIAVVSFSVDYEPTAVRRKKTKSKNTEVTLIYSVKIAVFWKELTFLYFRRKISLI